MAEQPSDSTLLERFARGGEQDAFALLMRRHGPRVLAACRRVLASEHDAEEVAQAAFLVLARKAGVVSWRGSVGPWLCGVARRLSLNARVGRSRRGRREVPVAALAGRGGTDPAGLFPEDAHPWADPLVEITRKELRGVIDRELSQLPEKYRAAVVLCDLEGMTHDEAARTLGWPTGSMSRRLGQGRALLRQRLAVRGLAVALVLFCGLLAALPERHRPAARGPARAAVREALAATGKAGHGGNELEGLLDRIASGEGRPVTRREADGAAGASARLAERVAVLDHGGDAGSWRSLAGGLYRAASRMSQAARDGDAPALRGAARVVQENCVRCHLAFRDGGAPPPLP